MEQYLKMINQSNNIFLKYFLYKWFDYLVVFCLCFLGEVVLDILKKQSAKNSGKEYSPIKWYQKIPIAIIVTLISHGIIDSYVLPKNFDIGISIAISALVCIVVYQLLLALVTNPKKVLGLFGYGKVGEALENSENKKSRKRKT